MKGNQECYHLRTTHYRFEWNFIAAVDIPEFDYCIFCGKIFKEHGVRLELLEDIRNRESEQYEVRGRLR